MNLKRAIPPLIFGALAYFDATLTLPGIAGIVLTIGMAVDANVLIYERIREELKRTKGPARAILEGERVALNFVTHLSGVATAAREVVRNAGPFPSPPREIQSGVRVVAAFPAGSPFQL